MFFGPTGRGKTHAATALGMMAASAGMPVRFWQTAQLVLALGKAKRDGSLDRLLADVARARVLVLDEFGYVPFDVDGARLLYQVISESYEQRAVVFTTNVEFSRWGTVFADDKLAAAIVDRVVHHGRLVEFGGPSHRLEDARIRARQRLGGGGGLRRAVPARGPVAGPVRGLPARGRLRALPLAVRGGRDRLPRGDGQGRRRRRR